MKTFQHLKLLAVARSELEAAWILSHPGPFPPASPAGAGGLLQKRLHPARQRGCSRCQTLRIKIAWSHDESWMFTLFLFWNPAPYLAFKVHKSNRLESPWKLRFDVLFVGEVSSQMPESPPSYWRGWEDAGNLQMNKAAAHGIPDEIRGTKPDTVLEGHEVLGWDMFRPWGMDGNSGHKNVGLFIGITEDQWIHPDSGLSFTIGWWYTAYFCPLNDGKHDDKQLIFFWGLHQTHVVTTIFMCETVINILAKD
jgi:hypothetical protein